MRSVLTLFIVLLCLLAVASAQRSGLATTWNFPDTEALTRTLEKGSSVANPAACVFKPGPDPGVAAQLARSMAGRPEDEAPMLKQLADLREVYDLSMVKEGHLNNLASAFTYFLSCNMAVYNDDEPTEDAQTRLYQQLESAIAATPEVADLSDAEKQRMHDWLVAVGGLSLEFYVGAQLSKDGLAMDNAKQVAGGAMRLVLGVDPRALTLDDRGLTIDRGI